MKFRKFGRISLALAVSLATGMGVTSCSTDHTVGYLYVTGSAIQSDFRLQDRQQSRQSSTNPQLSLRLRRIQSRQSPRGQFGEISVCPERRVRRNRPGCMPCEYTPPADSGANILLFTVGGQGGLRLQTTYTSQGNQPIAIQTDAAGTHLFVLDSQVPDPQQLRGLRGRKTGDHMRRYHILQHRLQYPAGFR